MRLKINCNFDSKIIPKDFRSKVVSLFKSGIRKSSPERYEDLFGGNKYKQYTFSVYLPKPRNEGAEIHLDEPNCIINFSTGDAETGVVFYNALISLRDSKILFGAGNNITIKNIQMVPEKKIISNRTILKTLSPLVSRDHNRETFKNWFYSFEDKKFEPILKRNMLPYLVEAFGEQARYDLEKLKITPISMKKVVVYCHEIHIESSVGIFELEAEPYLQNYLLENGIGTMTGSGFGMIEQL
ncbi:CRISPR-associated endoribonuclease Cas6 [Listeria welshimeri]|nr:CRISPR-associated endoribonuclease Cas6 [Listeria welshimeri]MBC6175790.1 CRISPR-associated endoribonuclease Cas6 [Listeria welshimeri]MBC6177016.1 CRISPR-associated endoribonuclease Cas6 [Listeria welshimeri]